MAKNLETQGEIYSIGPTSTFGNNGFTKREFVIKLTGEGENLTYPNYVAFELIKDKCALMDNYQLGDAIKVHFNLTGRLWSGNGKPEKCFTALQAWRIENLGQQVSAPAISQAGGFPDNAYGDDDVPF